MATVKSTPIVCTQNWNSTKLVTLVCPVLSPKLASAQLGDILPQCIASVGFPHDSACASAAGVCHVDLDSDWSSDIAAATVVGDWPGITLGIGMMSVYVVGLNRLIWRQLYQLAETKYHP